MHYDPITAINFQKTQRINTSLLVFLVISIIAYFVHTTDVQIFRYLAIVTVTFFSFYLVMSTKKEGFAAGFCVLLGCATVIFGILISNDTAVTDNFPIKFQMSHEEISDQKHRLQALKEYLHLHSLLIGISCIGLGLIFAYRPSLIQVKNYLPFEYPYPIWNSKNQSLTKFSKRLIPTKELLNNKERMLLCRFKYLLVSIDSKTYLVSPNEMVPEGSIIMRTKSGNMMCGISRF